MNKFKLTQKQFTHSYNSFKMDAQVSIDNLFNLTIHIAFGDHYLIKSRLFRYMRM